MTRSNDTFRGSFIGLFTHCFDSKVSVHLERNTIFKNPLNVELVHTL